MTRLGTLISCAVFGVGAALLGCGSSGSGGGAGGTGVGGAGVGGGGGGVGGGTSAGILDVIPRDNTIAGWTVDTASTNLAAGKVAAIATTKDQATTDLHLDGAAEAFYKNPAYVPTTFALQNYVNSTLNAPAGYTMTLFVMQMPSADAASGLYAYLPASGEAFYKITWEEPTSPVVGTQSRISNPGTQWWINFYKDTYYVEAFLSSDDNTTTGSSSTAAKAVAIDFATKLAAKM